MEAKAGGVTEVTTGQMDQIKSVLGTKGISAPILRKLLPGNQSEMYEQAVEDVSLQNTIQSQSKARHYILYNQFVELPFVSLYLLPPFWLIYSSIYL